MPDPKFSAFTTDELITEIAERKLNDTHIVKLAAAFAGEQTKSLVYSVHDQIQMELDTLCGNDWYEGDYQGCDTIAYLKHRDAIVRLVKWRNILDPEQWKVGVTCVDRDLCTAEDMKDEDSIRRFSEGHANFELDSEIAEFYEKGWIQADQVSDEARKILKCNGDRSRLYVDRPEYGPSTLRVKNV